VKIGFIISYIKNIIDVYNGVLANIHRPCTIHGIIIINPIMIGKSFVQQKDINWSNLILGKEALIQMNKNIKILVFIPKNNPCKIP
jgi:hypothetical protein